MNQNIKKYYLKNNFGIINWMIMTHDSNYFVFKLDSQTRFKAKFNERLYLIYKKFFQNVDTLSLEDCKLKFPQHEQVLEMKILQKSSPLTGQYIFIRTNSISKEFRIVNLNSSDIIQFAKFEDEGI